jgi:16S rRNA (adenine1518-N6/adenine1519-N6)-dimethyltransferase
VVSKPRPLLTPSEVRRLLVAHGIAPRKAHGQNFVVDANTVRKVVRDAGVRPGDLVCEVGPGLGSLTLALREAGARVVAVEVDSGLVAALQDVLGGDRDARVVHADALDVEFAELLGGRPAAMVANLPYNIATPLVMRALRSGAFTTVFVMVQREVGERWVAQAGDRQYGAVSVKVAAMAEAEVVAMVSRNAFFPPPNVDSVTVRLTPRPWQASVERDALFALVEAGFRQRRKRLRNALAGEGRTPASIEAALTEVGLPAGSRAEELSLDDWVALTGAL